MSTDMHVKSTREVLLDLAEKFDKRAAETSGPGRLNEDSPYYVGYRLAMEHAAERARQAAADHG